MRYNVKSLKRYSGPAGGDRKENRQFRTFEDLEVYQRCNVLTM